MLSPVLTCRWQYGCTASAAKNVLLISDLASLRVLGSCCRVIAKVCAGGVVTYTISNNPNVTSYNWMMPATATLFPDGISILLQSRFGNFTSANICVTATNAWYFPGKMQICIKTAIFQLVIWLVIYIWKLQRHG
ncbi:MAG: hypothetical protein IPL22_18515 [Bacteroidetes bacterium]|nr:hypothetical protein [Bacteroidota bacterium]